MPSASFPDVLPLAATMDLQYRLPPFQQLILNDTIIVSLVLLAAALLVVILLALRASAKAKREGRLEALRMAEKILIKRGGDPDDVEKILYAFKSNPAIDPAAMVMVKDKFANEFKPLLSTMYGEDFTERIAKLYFPPPQDTRHILGVGSTQDLKALVGEKKSTGIVRTSTAIVDLMDATLRPGTVLKLTFEGIEGGYECMVMGHDMDKINITLPANNNILVSSLRQGMAVEGTMENGPSLLAFTSDVVQAVAGSMPYCRLTAWKAAWEVRKREAVRLPISVEIDFQHISVTSSTIRIANIDKELGVIRPGRLMDISLGGCCLETPSSGTFNIGDMVRFSKSLVTGSPPATLLGAIVKADAINPAENEGATQRLHVQFLIIDDVSQRILVRTIRQLQDVMAREEWMQAQQLLQRMRRNKLDHLGELGAGTRTLPPRSTSARLRAMAKAEAATARVPTRAAPRPSTRVGGTAQEPRMTRPSITRPNGAEKPGSDSERRVSKNPPPPDSESR